MVASFFHDKDKLVKAMRGNGALPWGDHHPCMFSGTERFFRPGYKGHLIAEWLPALDGVVAKLEEGAKVADIGCGHGASTVIMAQAFPNSRFVGFDYHAPSITVATQRAEEGGVSSRAKFFQGTAKSYPGDDYDLICYFDCLHDMGDPVGAARHAYDSLKDDGTVLLVEPFANDTLDDNINPVGRLVLRSVDVHLHAELAVAGSRPRPRGASGGNAPAQSVYRGRIQAVPPGDADAVQPDSGGAQVTATRVAC